MIIKICGGINKTGIMEIDISSLTDYTFFSIYGCAESGDITVSEIWLE